MKNLKMILFVTLLFLTACSNATQNPEDPTLDFYAPMKTTSENEVEINLQIASPKADFDADSEFNGNMKIYAPNNELRAEAVMKENPFMKKGETYQIMTWKGFLEPGEYLLEWYSEKYGGTQIEFEVEKLESGNFSIGHQKILIIPTN